MAPSNCNKEIPECDLHGNFYTETSRHHPYVTSGWQWHPKDFMDSLTSSVLNFFIPVTVHSAPWPQSWERIPGLPSYTVQTTCRRPMRCEGCRQGWSQGCTTSTNSLRHWGLWSQSVHQQAGQPKISAGSRPESGLWPPAINTTGFDRKESSRQPRGQNQHLEQFYLQLITWII